MIQTTPHDCPTADTKVSRAEPPANWIQTSMGRIGFTYGGLTGKAKAHFGRGTALYVTFLNVLQNVTIDPSLFEAVDVEPGESQNPVLRGDILFNGTSETPEDVALAAVLESDVPRLFLNSFCFGFRIFDPELNDARFLAYFFRGPTGRQLVSALAQGATRYNISKRQFLSLAIALPSPAEQRSIAEALSDVDRLLGALEALIAKKRAMKQAAMQQLLTGKTRLPGFSGEWETKRLGELGRFRGGTGFPTAAQGVTSGDYPFFKVSDMNNDGNETFMQVANNYVSDEVRKALGATAFPANSIVFAKVGAAVFLERKKVLSKPSCLDNNMAAFVLDHGAADYRFIHLVFLNTTLGDLVSTTALPSLSNSIMSSIECRLPPIDEQSAIATVLSDMDAEITALEARRDKTRAIKQGMMQQLLTGRVRLEKPEAAA